MPEPDFERPYRSLSMWLLALTFGTVFAAGCWFMVHTGAPPALSWIYGVGAGVLYTQPLWMSLVDL